MNILKHEKSGKPIGIRVDL